MHQYLQSRNRSHCKERNRLFGTVICYKEVLQNAHRSPVCTQGNVHQMIFREHRVFCECLLITRGIVIKKSICMIPFHVGQQGYTVRLNAGSIPFQKNQFAASPAVAASLHRALGGCARSKFCIGTFKLY